MNDASIEARLERLERIMSVFISAVAGAAGIEIPQVSDVDIVNVSRPRLEAVEGGGDQDRDGRRGHLRAV